jgi:two-component system, NarL family, invasion response regulator UvrY
VVRTEISVLLVDDHTIMRRGCRQVLEQNRICVRHEVSSGEKACRLSQENPSSVVGLNISMAGMTGLETIRHVRSRTSEQCLVEAARFAAVSKMNLSHDTAQASTIAGLFAQTNPLDVPPTRELEIYCVLMEDRKTVHIAVALSLAAKSVSNNYLRIKAELRARSVADLVRLGFS